MYNSEGDHFTHNYTLKKEDGSYLSGVDLHDDLEDDLEPVLGNTDYSTYLFENVTDRVVENHNQSKVHIVGIYCCYNYRII